MSKHPVVPARCLALDLPKQSSSEDVQLPLRPREVVLSRLSRVRWTAVQTERRCTPRHAAILPLLSLYKGTVCRPMFPLASVLKEDRTTGKSMTSQSVSRTVAVMIMAVLVAIVVPPLSCHMMKPSAEDSKSWFTA